MAVGVTRLDDRQFVGMLADVWKVVRDQQSTFTARMELAKCGGQVPNLATAGVDVIRLVTACPRTFPARACSRTYPPGSARRSSSGKCRPSPSSEFARGERPEELCCRWRWPVVQKSHLDPTTTSTQGPRIRRPSARRIRVENFRRETSSWGMA